jgi:hypothetical protein
MQNFALAHETSSRLSPVPSGLRCDQRSPSQVSAPPQSSTTTHDRAVEQEIE